MATIGLPLDWAFRPTLDLELKEYMLLAYLQRVAHRFTERKLYPHLDELREHLDELERVRQRKLQLERSLGGDFLGFDPLTGAALHEALPQPSSLAVVDEIIELAIPGLRNALEHGSGLREELAAHIHFAPVGVLPLITHEGWLLLRLGSDARVYSYRVPLLRTAEAAAGRYHVRTRYVTSYTVGIGRTFEHIKTDLIDTFRSMPNPAVFAFETDLSLPHIETFMPLAKQLVYEVIAPER